TTTTSADDGNMLLEPRFFRMAAPTGPGRPRCIGIIYVSGGGDHLFAHQSESSSARSHHLVLQRRLATPQAIEILEQHVEHVVLIALRFAGGMRRDQHVVEAPQGR